jgi:hypothetical protein
LCRGAAQTSADRIGETRSGLSPRGCRSGERHDREEIMQNECDTCALYAYDDDYGDYICEADMDEDDYVRFITDSHSSCPYYQGGDEYTIVRHQM